eukprot:COSAG01_NODE_65101_length_274_cov_0.742857_1_plen_40_part_01
MDSSSAELMTCHFQIERLSAIAWKISGSLRDRSVVSLRSC